jgi:hypothetical protein
MYSQSQVPEIYQWKASQLCRTLSPSYGLILAWLLLPFPSMTNPSPQEFPSDPLSSPPSADNLASLFQKTEGINHDCLQTPVFPDLPSASASSLYKLIFSHSDLPISYCSKRWHFFSFPGISLDTIHPFNQKIFTRYLLCDSQGPRLVNKTKKLMKFHSKEERQ